MTEISPPQRALAEPCITCRAHYMCQRCIAELHRKHQELLDHPMPEPLIPAVYDGVVVEDPT